MYTTSGHDQDYNITQKQTKPYIYNNLHKLVNILKYMLESLHIPNADYTLLGLLLLPLEALPPHVAMYVSRVAILSGFFLYSLCKFNPSKATPYPQYCNKETGDPKTKTDKATNKISCKLQNHLKHNQKAQNQQ